DRWPSALARERPRSGMTSNFPTSNGKDKRSSPQMTKAKPYCWGARGAICGIREEEFMASLSQHIMSRRGFCLCCVAATTVAASGGWLTPRQAFAKARNIVDLIRDDAAKAAIKIHKLRGNVSILEGSGGNIAVLIGADGKLFVDAGITASRPRLLEAASSLS